MHKFTLRRRSWGKYFNNVINFGVIIFVAHMTSDTLDARKYIIATSSELQKLYDDTL